MAQFPDSISFAKAITPVDGLVGSGNHKWFETLTGHTGAHHGKAAQLARRCRFAQPDRGGRRRCTGGAYAEAPPGGGVSAQSSDPSQCGTLTVGYGKGPRYEAGSKGAVRTELSITGLTSACAGKQLTIHAAGPSGLRGTAAGQVPGGKNRVVLVLDRPVPVGSLSTLAVTAS